MRIADVRTHVLIDPGYDVGSTSSAQDTIVVEIETDDGIVGIGETDLNAWIARACIEAPGTHTMDRGLRALPKLALTAVAAVAFFVVLGPQPLVVFPFGTVPAWLWYGLSLCAVLATTHAVNLTDGLDGLAAGVVIPPLFVLICACHYSSATIGVPFFGAAMIGAVGAFLIYNRHPARVFMGDTGSLGLGAALSGIAILTGMQLLLLIVGGVFVAETLSVIIQVISYKTTRRRVFRMSPLHHHFELAGWSEAVVTTRFWLASLVVSALGFTLLVSLVHARID